MHQASDIGEVTLLRCLQQMLTPTTQHQILCALLCIYVVHITQDMEIGIFHHYKYRSDTLLHHGYHGSRIYDVNYTERITYKI